MQAQVQCINNLRKILTKQKKAHSQICPWTVLYVDVSGCWEFWIGTQIRVQRILTWNIN